jgi:hypothetical protein
MPPVLSKLSYDLRLGVTGHRTLPDPAGIARAVRILLDRIERTLARSSTPLTWTVVSPLARGADRLVAEAVLERPDARLEVVTPFPLDEYRKDFQADEDRAAFEALLGRAALVHELDASSRGGVSEGDAPERDEGYLRAGERVVDACEILIAIWNGRPAAGRGGTADIVRYALLRERMVLWIHEERPLDPPRVIRRHPGDGAQPAHAAPPESDDFPLTAKTLSRGYHEQAAYCADTALDRGKFDAAQHEARDALIRGAGDSRMDPVALEPVLGQMVPEFVRADQLALIYQRKYTLATRSVLYLAAAAVTVAVGQVLFLPDRLWVILFEVLGMVAILGLWWYGRREAWHEKWRHDRYLAERLRTAIFTTLAGCVPRESRAGNPLPFYRGPQQWLSSIVRSVAQSAARNRVVLPTRPLQSFLIGGWLGNQLRFHAGNAVRKHAAAHRRHALGVGLFAATLVMAVLHMMGVGHAEAAVPRIGRVDLWITFLALVLPVWAGAVHALTSQLELERIAERSRRMAPVLEGVVYRAERARTSDELARIADEAAELMTIENHEWWVLLSFQDLRLHV